MFGCSPKVKTFLNTPGNILKVLSKNKNLDHKYDKHFTQNNFKICKILYIIDNSKDGLR